MWRIGLAFVLVLVLGGSLLGVEASLANASASGSLTIGITMLPDNVPGHVTVTGPGGFSRQIVRTTTFGGLAAGAYAIHAGPTRHGSLQYFPVTPDSNVTLGSGGQGSVTVSYADVVPDTTLVVPPS